MPDEVIKPKKALDIESIIADPTKQEEGVWRTYDEDTGAAFLLTYIGNKKYQDKLSKLLTKARRKTRGRDVEDHVYQAIIAKAMAGTIVRNWKLLAKGGADFPFSEANAEWLLNNSPEAKMFIHGEANDLSIFQDNPEGEIEDAPQGALKSGAPVES